MKICWWQAGLHFEPETKAETDALMILWEAKKTPSHISDAPHGSTSGIVREELLNNGAGN
jgi:hypothetical protein